MDKEEVDYSKESVLVVDDDFHIRETLQKLLAALGFTSKAAAGGPEALQILEEEKHTFLLTDMKMPEMDGMELIVEVNKNYPNMSIIAMTGYSEGYRYIDVINAGASDFIKKPFEVDELEAKVKRIITERNLRERLNWLSITDSLTGLYNQRHFYARLHEETTRADRQKHSLSLVILDLNRFKDYNDTYGHLAGDDILRNVGRIINQCIRVGVDTGYRYGGDEFALILIDADLHVATGIVDRIQSALNKGGITASIGLAKFAEEMSDKDLILEADKNLYKDKLQTKQEVESN